MPTPFVWPRVAAVALATTLLALGVFGSAWPWVVDDAFISLRFADRLAEGKGLGWTDGEWVEGYSNLAWVLLTAALRWLGCDALLAVRGLGIACMLTTLVVLARSSWLPRSGAGLLAVPTFASTGCAATWTVAGLEGPLLLLLLTIGFDRTVVAWREPTRRTPWLAAGTAFALAAATRPDAPLFLAAAALSTFAFVGTGTSASPSWSVRARAVAWLVAIPALALLAHTLFRLGYYGEWLPNTAVAKLTSSATSRSVGWLYVESNLLAARALVVPALLGLVAIAPRASRAPATVAAAAALAWLAYVVHVGGDAFPRGRLFAPALLPLTVLAAHGLHWFAQRGRSGAWATWAFAAAAIALGVVDARNDGGDPRQRLSDWEWQGKATGEWLQRGFGTQSPLLAVDAAGAVPYYSRLPSLDMLGLCDHTIARTPYPAGEPFVVAHARGNGAYVLARRPDLVLFGTPPGSPQPQWLGGRQLEADATFRADYRLVLFDLGTVTLENGKTAAMRIPAWTHVVGRLGLQPDPSQPNQFVLPGYWLGSYRQPYSFLEAAAGRTAIDAATLQQDLHEGAQRLLTPAVVGVLAVGHDGPVGEVRRAGRIVAPALPLPPGRYRIGAAALPAGVTMTLAGPAVTTAPDHVRVNGATPAMAVDVVCMVPEATPLPFYIARVELNRID